MTLPFAGRTALITGASGGIGAAVARALAESGADLALCDLRFDDLGQAVINDAQKLGRRVAVGAFDVCDRESVEEFVKDVVANFGGIDHFVASAVFSEREPFTTADMAGFRQTVDVSLWGAYFMFREIANAMIARGQGGSVVVVSSPHAVVPYPNCMAYNIGKAAQDMMARTAAIELLPHRIRVNIAHPGWTDTPGERKFYTEAQIAAIGPTLPGGRMVRPAEVARGVLFLLHPDADQINGITLTIDGGLNLPYWSKRASGEI